MITFYAGISFKNGISWERSHSWNFICLIFKVSVFCIQIQCASLYILCLHSRIFTSNVATIVSLFYYFFIIFQSSIWTLTSVVTMTLNPDDLSDLEVLDENTIVQALRSRYNKEKFYVSFYSVYIKMPACYKCRISIKILIINFVWLKPVIVKRIH